jgi:hypothetical protein
VERFGSWGSFLAGDQSGDRGQHRVEMFASAEMAREGSPGLQVADAVLDVESLCGVSPASASCATVGLPYRCPRGDVPHAHMAPAPARAGDMRLAVAPTSVITVAATRSVYATGLLP